MRIAKKLAVAAVGLAFAGAVGPAAVPSARPSAPAASHHPVAGPRADGCDSWGDCWDTWGGGGTW